MRLLINLSLMGIFTFTSFAFSKMHFVHIKTKDKQIRSEIASMAHLDDVVEDSIYTTVNETDFANIKKNFSNLIVETHEIDLGLDEMNKTFQDVIEFPEKDTKYHTFAEVKQALEKLTQQYPEIAVLKSLGTTYEGIDIPMIRITSKENRKGNSFTPGIFFVGSHHAREHLSTEVPVRLAKYILENHASNTRIQRLVRTRDIYIAPTLNIDGKNHDLKGRRYKMWRKNRRINEGSNKIGVDLNRNYGFGWGTGGSSKNPGSDVYMGPQPFSEPETKAVRRFIENHPNIRIMLSYHTFSELILYPWGGKNDPVGGEDERIFKKMAKQMAEWTKYKPQQSSDLYVASGDTCDWAYGEHGIYCFTFELSPKSMWTGGFYPGAKAIDPTFQVNIEPALYLIDLADNPKRVLTKN